MESNFAAETGSEHSQAFIEGEARQRERLNVGSRHLQITPRSTAFCWHFGVVDREYCRVRRILSVATCEGEILRIAVLTRCHHFGSVDVLSSVANDALDRVRKTSMPKQPRLPLSDAEREVLKVLWEKGPLGVREVSLRLAGAGQEWTRSTVMTLMRRLETKGYVGADRSGYAFVYRPLVTRQDVMHARIQEVASELADGETIPLMLAFAERQRFSDAELARLQKMIDELKARAKSKRQRD